MKKILAFILMTIFATTIMVSCGESASEEVQGETRDYSETPSTEPDQGPNTFGSGENGPAMAFEKTTYNFGDVKKGDIVTYPFLFTNSGKDTLVITAARTSCGCTTSKLPKGEPIAPGVTDTIEVQFNTTHKNPKEYTKEVLILSNIPDDTAMVTIKATVVQ